MMKPVRNLIFDLDGTLVDSMPYYTDAITDILKAQGIAYDQQEIVRDVTKLNRVGIAKYLIEHFNVNATVDAIVAVIDQNSLAAYRTAIPTKDGVVETLWELSRSGYELSVLTATPHPLVDECLTRLKIYDCFGHVWSCSDFGTSKNSPKIFYAVAERLGVKTRECVMLDDNFDALTNAQKAGMHTIGVYDPSSEHLSNRMKEQFDGYVYRLWEIPSLL
ncbi:MAG TPA: hypothetical protein DDW30_05500 [Clostridiales bacterium]|nr:hypothetical protein [Clostridiales bacterium]